MRKIILAFVLSFLCVTCKDSKQVTAKDTISKQIVDKNTKTDQLNNSKSILDYITDLLLSSDFEVLKDWPKESIYIYSEDYNECGNFIYCFRVLSSPAPRETEVNSVTIALLCYNAKERKFYDIFQDHKTPLNMNYDKNIEVKLLQKIKDTCSSFLK